MKEEYRFRVSDFYKPWNGLIDYNERVAIEDDSFKVQWRGSLLAFYHTILPTLIAVCFGVATTIYFEKENKIKKSIISGRNLESSIME